MYTYLLLLLAGLMCCTNAAENRNNEEALGGEDIDNYYYMRMKKKGVKNDRNRVKLNANYKNIATQSIKTYFNNDIDEPKIINMKTIETPVYKQKILYVNFEITQESVHKTCSVLFELPRHHDPLTITCTTTEPIDGGFEWVDPSSPKYVHLAEKSLFKSTLASLRSVPRWSYDTIVTFVMRQVVAGHNNSINFIIRPVNSHTYECISHVWEQTNRQILVEDVSCHLKTKSKPKPQNNELTSMYSGLGKAAVKEFIKNQPNKPDLIDVNVKNTALIETSVFHKEIVYINYDVTYRKNSLNTTCSVIYEVPNRKHLNIKCHDNVLGSIWVDPSDQKILNMAEKSGMFDKYRHDVIVTFALKLITRDTTYIIDFIARPIDKKTYDCNLTWQTTGGGSDDSVSCQLRGNSSLPLSDNSDF